MSGWRAQRALVRINDGTDGQYRQHENDEFINHEVMMSCRIYYMMSMLTVLTVNAVIYMQTASIPDGIDF